MTGLPFCDMPRLIGKPVHRRGLGFGAHALGVIVGPVSSTSVPAVVDVQWRTGERTSCRAEALELILSPTTTERIEMPPTKKKAPAKATAKKASAKTSKERRYQYAQDVVLARVDELGLTRQQIAEHLTCSPSTVRNTLFVSQSPAAPQPGRMRRLSEFLGWKPDALQLLVEEGIEPELAEDGAAADEPAPESVPAVAARVTRKPAAARSRAKVTREEALPPPASPFVKRPGLRDSITILQKRDDKQDEAIHALQREIADLKAIVADICEGLGVDGPKVRKSA